MDDIISLWSKQCCRCKQVKKLDEFLRDRTTPDGYAYACKACKGILPKEFIPPGMKRCTTCTNIKPIDDFCKSSRLKSGYTSVCKECKNEQERNRLKEHPQKVYPLMPLDTASITLRECSSCSEVKTINLFVINRHCPTGYTQFCKDCKSAYRRHERKVKPTPSSTIRKRNLKGFDLTPEQYEKMLQEQGGVCICCKNEETAKDNFKGVPRRLAIDHCHKTGTIRGLLCGRCNLAFGLLQEDPERIRALLAYAEKWQIG